MTKLNDDLIVLKPISVFQKDYDYYVELQSTSSNKKINILIGDVEATNIYLNMNKDIYQLPKPNIYQLYIDSLDKFNIRISGLLITSLQNNFQWDGIIELINIDTQDITLLDARPSDMIILSLIEKIPLTIYSQLLNKIYNKAKNTISKTKYHPNDVTDTIISTNELNKLPTQKLKNLMNEYIKLEKYEKADEINKIIISRGE